ncbi:hypothetical protein BJ508DRAFT_311354 [Ascobolus immersus RN42]|uniref:BZIP domain-containing protein n=1 Tax=Ascobolus immersus RN42 TaxID=1160509 RepID=A0A3N4HT06_ASCIM|nr:hypothetical protein BJ508DRAFT_311354 [Ascobolus immersus RN42]
MPPKRNLRKRPPPRSPSPEYRTPSPEPASKRRAPSSRASTPSNDTPYPDRLLSSLNTLLDAPPPHLSEAEIATLANRRKLLLNRKAAKQTRQKAKTAQEEMVELVKDRARVVRAQRDQVALMTVRQGLAAERERELREIGEARRGLEAARMGWESQGGARFHGDGLLQSGRNEVRDSTAFDGGGGLQVRRVRRVGALAQEQVSSREMASEPGIALT